MFFLFYRKLHKRYRKLIVSEKLQNMEDDELKFYDIDL